MSRFRKLGGASHLRKKKKGAPAEDPAVAENAANLPAEGENPESKENGENSENKTTAAVKKRKWPTVLLIIIFIVGLGILLYPTISNWWNSFHSSRAISNYAERVANLNDEEYNKLLQSAYEYNKSILEKRSQYSMSSADQADYNSQLDFEGTHIIGYIEIDKIKVSLPIYHGTSDTVLQIATGHVDWSSLPVGGESTHAVISGHRGLPSAKLFTNLDRLEEGDIFVIRVLNEILTYEVDQIKVVLPSDTSPLEIVEGEDLVTLVTCTPYGINTHRLLVRGHRIENKPDHQKVKIISDATRIEPLVIAPVIAIPILLILLVTVLIRDKRRGKNREDDSEDVFNNKE